MVTPETAAGDSATAEPERVLTAMVTPFKPDGSLNLDGAQGLADYLVYHGSDGLVLAGTTGESPTLTHDEQLTLFDTVRKAVGDDVLLIGGTGSNSTAEAAELTREASNRGSVNGLLVVSPYYNKPSQYGIEQYYRDLADQTDLPITLYNIPGRTGRLVELDTIRRLAGDGQIAALKDATGSVAMAQLLAAEYGEDLSIYSGDDNLNLEFARIGAIGGISVASHWAGAEIRQMFEAYFSGNEQMAEDAHAALMPSYTFETTHTGQDGREHDTPNPAPAKAMMAHILGSRMVSALCRPPMNVSPEEQAYLEGAAPEVLNNLRAAMADNRSRSSHGT